jgi:flagellar motor switch protein FliG
MLLILLGKEQASGVLKYLEPDEVERLTREIAAIDRITDREAVRVLEEFGVLAREGRGTVRGGLSAAREILESSFGPERGQELLERVRERIGPSFRFMDGVEPEQAALLLASESAPVVAAVLSQLDPAQAAGVLALLPPPRQTETVMRLGTLKRLAPDVLEHVERALKDKLETQGRVVTRSVDGRAALASILAHLPRADEQRLLEEIAQDNPELHEALEEKLFDLATLLRARRRDLQAFLRSVDDRSLAMALKGRDEQSRDKLLSGVSAGRRARVEEEGAALGAVSRRDADRALHDLLMVARDWWQQGRIVLDGEEELVE